MKHPNPTAINYPYYHDGIAFHSASEFQAHLDKDTATAPVAQASGRRAGRKVAASGAEAASNVDELAAGLADAAVGDDDQTDEAE